MTMFESWVYGCNLPQCDDLEDYEIEDEQDLYIINMEDEDE